MLEVATQEHLVDLSLFTLALFGKHGSDILHCPFIEVYALVLASFLRASAGAAEVQLLSLVLQKYHEKLCAVCRPSHATVVTNKATTAISRKKIQETASAHCKNTIRQEPKGK